MRHATRPDGRQAPLSPRCVIDTPRGRDDAWLIAPTISPRPGQDDSLTYIAAVAHICFLPFSFSFHIIRSGHALFFARHLETAKYDAELSAAILLRPTYFIYTKYRSRRLLKTPTTFPSRQGNVE